MFKKVRVLQEMINPGNGKTYKVGDIKTLHPSYANQLIGEGKAEYLQDDCGCPDDKKSETVATVDAGIKSAPKPKRKKRTKPNDSIA